MNTTVKNLFQQFCKVYDLKTSATTRNENPSQKDYYSNDFVKMDYAPVYGGYVIRKVFKGTSEDGFDGLERRSAKEMIAFLKGLLAAKNHLNFEGITNN